MPTGRDLGITALVLIAVLLVLFITAALLLWDWLWRRWEAEEAESQRRKKEILQKRSLSQPEHCPYCDIILHPTSSNYAQCPMCGRLVTTKGDNSDHSAQKSP